MVLLTPYDNVTHHSLVLGLITLVDTSNYSRIIRKLLKMVRLCVVVEVCGVDCKKDSPLRTHNVADHNVRHSVDILLSASQVANNPGHKGGIHLHHCYFLTRQGWLVLKAL